MANLKKIYQRRGKINKIEEFRNGKLIKSFTKTKKIWTDTISGKKVGFFKSLILNFQK